MEVKKHKDKQPKYPPWFQDFYENDYKPFQEQVIKKFDEISNLLSNIIKYNNLKTHK